MAAIPGQWSDSNWDARPHDSYGLHYNLNRWYDPNLGLYTQPDLYLSAAGGCKKEAGCTLMHEMTHMVGHLFEKHPRKVEKCLGCDKSPF